MFSGPTGASKVQGANKEVLRALWGLIGFEILGGYTCGGARGGAVVTFIKLRADSRMQEEFLLLQGLGSSVLGCRD